MEDANLASEDEGVDDVADELEGVEEGEPKKSLMSCDCRNDEDEGLEGVRAHVSFTKVTFLTVLMNP